MARKWGVCLWLALAWAGAANRVPQFSLPDTAGRVHTPAEWSGKRAVVLFFLTTDCPLCNNYVPELNRIAQAFSARGVAFYGVQGDATVPEPDVRRHVQEQPRHKKRVTDVGVEHGRSREEAVGEALVN
jgi:thiol-disulfide isomerase/thioredoxin